MSGNQFEKPVLLQALPEAPNPLRFGLREIFGLMAITAAQCALMYYLSPLWGLAVGVGLCLLLLLTLLFLAMFFHDKHGSSWMDRLDRLAIQTTLAIVALSVAVVLAGGGALAYSAALSRQLETNLEADLGFTARRGFAFTATSADEVLVITDIKVGGSFEQAGFQAGDVIVTDDTPHDFFVRMDQARGGEMAINVAANAEGTDLSKATVRTLSLPIPTRP